MTKREEGQPSSRRHAPLYRVPVCVGLISPVTSLRRQLPFVLLSRDLFFAQGIVITRPVIIDHITCISALEDRLIAPERDRIDGGKLQVAIATFFAQFRGHDDVLQVLVSRRIVDHDGDIAGFGCADTANRGGKILVAISIEVADAIAKTPITEARPTRQSIRSARLSILGGPAPRRP